MSCAAQRAAGHEVTLAYGPIYGPEGSLLDKAKASGATLVELASMRRSVSPWHDWRCYMELRRLIRKIRPEVVHTHSSKAGILGRAAAWREAVPGVIHTVHGLPFHERQSPLVYHGYVLAERWAAKRCHHLIAITPAMVEAFSAKHIVTPPGSQCFTVIPSGVELSQFKTNPDLRAQVRRELGIPTDAPVLGIVARLDRLKGHDDLLDILPQLHQRFSDLHLLCIGDGWERKRIEKRIAAEGLAARVILAGLIPPTQVARLLSGVDVKVLPSYQEGQSRTLVEALLCGCGIVAYDVGGISSVCIDGQTGRLVTLGDKAALAQAIIWMFEHPQQRDAMVQAGRTYARRMFDAQAMVEMVERVYYEVLNRKQTV